MARMGLVTVCWMILGTAASGQEQVLTVRVSWGHTSREATSFHIECVAKEAVIAALAGIELEPEDRVQDGVCETRSGNGDVDGIEFLLQYAPVEVKPTGKVHQFWHDLIRQSDVDTARRLKQDPAYRPDPRVLTIQMDGDGAKGFSVTIDQLLQTKVFWVPSLDVYVTAGDAAPSFAQHGSQLGAYEGKRVLDQVRREPEATYEQYTARWEDMGSPAYKHPRQLPPGHTVGLTWDSALYKFGIDRGAGVRNDDSQADVLGFRFDFGDLAETWRGQRLLDGLPVLTTTIEQNGLCYEVEQFAYPLNGPPRERRGDIPMVLLQKVTVGGVPTDAGPVSLKLRQGREFSPPHEPKLTWRQEGDAILFGEEGDRRVFLVVQGSGLTVASCATNSLVYRRREKEWLFTEFKIVLTFDLAKNAGQEFVVKLPSPVVEPQDRDTLLRLDYAGCREATLKFWTDWVQRGTQFRVSEKVVNDLFRASLWHSLRLPRRHGGAEDGVEIDLPYSNFAYDQKGTPWPVNQAVYVDYMIYGLRGYQDVAAEELLTIFRNNQEPNGHVKGYANWGVYTPSMIYVVAKNYLLSGDRATFDRLLPYTLKALEWCLDEMRKASENEDAAGGMIRSPLNDLTGDGAWAFTQAYLYAAFETFGKALERAGHPGAEECSVVAQNFRASVEQAFGAAAMRSALVQLRDHTWTPYVPCEATRPGRRLEQWYPTDVDTGAMHLLRLKALPGSGVLADSLVNDHEDNLYLHGWGMANEPVYNPQATAYLLRDDPKAVIRAFYSYMACAFSHSALEPVEHRWTWGQYFGPPSTDGAWFELYRNMLIHELDDGSLLLLQATPRKWLVDGQQIAVEKVPTYYGDISLTVDSCAASGSLAATIQMPKRLAPRRLIVRFRHPETKPIQSVTVNGRAWTSFDVQKEWVMIERPVEERYTIISRY